MNDLLTGFTTWLIGFFAAAVVYLAVVHFAATKYRSLRSRRARFPED